MVVRGGNGCVTPWGPWFQVILSVAVIDAGEKSLAVAKRRHYVPSLRLAAEIRTVLSPGVLNGASFQDRFC